MNPAACFAGGVIALMSVPVPVVARRSWDRGGAGRLVGGSVTARGSCAGASLAVVMSRSMASVGLSVSIVDRSRARGVAAVGTRVAGVDAVCEGASGVSSAAEESCTATGFTGIPGTPEDTDAPGAPEASEDLGGD